MKHLELDQKISAPNNLMPDDADVQAQIWRSRYLEMFEIAKEYALKMGDLELSVKKWQQSSVDWKNDSSRNEHKYHALSDAYETLVEKLVDKCGAR